MTEDILHERVAAYLNLACPHPWTTFPAHGWRHMGTASRLKRQGVKPGWPDIQIIAAGGQYVGIELKAGRGVLSPAQSNTHARLAAAGARMFVCKSLAEVQIALQSLSSFCAK